MEAHQEWPNQEMEKNEEAVEGKEIQASKIHIKELVSIANQNKAGNEEIEAHEEWPYQEMGMN